MTSTCCNICRFVDFHGFAEFVLLRLPNRSVNAGHHVHEGVNAWKYPFIPGAAYEYAAAALSSASNAFIWPSIALCAAFVEASPASPADN